MPKPTLVQRCWRHRKTLTQATEWSTLLGWQLTNCRMQQLSSRKQEGPLTVQPIGTLEDLSCTHRRPLLQKENKIKCLVAHHLVHVVQTSVARAILTHAVVVFKVREELVGTLPTFNPLL